MTLKPITAGFIFALAAFHSAAAGGVSNMETHAQCTAATSQPAAQRPLGLRSAPSLACPIDQARFSPRTADAERNFSQTSVCAATMSMPRLATVVE